MQRNFNSNYGASRGKHRHFVALPLLVLGCTMVVVVNAAMPLSASLPLSKLNADITAGDSDQVIAIELRVSGILDQGGVLRIQRDGHSALLLHGTVSLASEDITELALPNGVSLFSIGGAVTVIRDDHYSTVVALRGPVGIVTEANRYLLPTGYQLRIDNENGVLMSAVTDAWREKSLKRIPDATGIEMQEDVRAEELQELLHADGRWTLERAQNALRLTEEIDTKQILSKLLALKLLTVSPSLDPEAASLLQKELLEEEWTHEALVFALPRQVLTTLHPVPSPLLDPWAEYAIRSGLRDMDSMTILLREAHLLPMKLDEAGYPIQSKQWEKALEKVLSVLQGTADKKNAPDLQMFRTTLTLRGNPGSMLSSAASYDSSESGIPVEELLYRTRQMLREHQVLMSGTTHLEPDSRATIKVTGVFLPSAETGSDASYEFSYDPEKKIFSNIIRNGQKLPNSVSEELFFE